MMTEKKITSLAAQPLSDAEVIELAGKPALDVGDFCRITEAEITGSHDRYIVSQEGVRYRPVSDHQLSNLFPGERDEILEQMRHTLSFPCTPAELVAFVKAADHCFLLPDGFAEAATGIPDRLPDEDPKERRIRIAKMRRAGMSGAKIGKVEGGITASKANTLAREGEEILADKAQKALTFAGQAMPNGVAVKKAKKQA
jgi:hypothetical protein